MANIINADIPTTLDIPADKVVTAVVGKLQDVIVIGYDLEGDFYHAQSMGSIAEALLLLEIAKMQLLESLLT